MGNWNSAILWSIFIISQTSMDQRAEEWFAGGQLPPPPGDSDTDSGICADSDNQLSPRHINATGYLDDRSKILQRKIEIPVYREHLTPESAWWAFCKFMFRYWYSGNWTGAVCRKKDSRQFNPPSSREVGVTRMLGKRTRKWPELKGQIVDSDLVLIRNKGKDESRNIRY